jgi:hypothetical protein
MSEVYNTANQNAEKIRVLSLLGKNWQNWLASLFVCLYRFGSAIISV